MNVLIIRYLDTLLFVLDSLSPCRCVCSPIIRMVDNIIRRANEPKMRAPVNGIA